MIEIRNTHILRGPNVWARVPVINLTVDIGELEHRPTHLIPGFTVRLLAALPTLVDHTCSLGRPGGFVERLQNGTWMGHVLEHVALELQRLAGGSVGRGKTRRSGTPGIYNVVYAYQQEDVGVAAGKLAARFLNHLVAPGDEEFDLSRHVEAEVIQLAERLAFGPSTFEIVSEAERRGIPVMRITPTRSLVQLGYGKRQRRIWATRTSSTSGMAMDIAGDKEQTRQLLRDVGIPAPRGGLATSAIAAARLAARIGYPVVVKPLDGNHGRGVGVQLECDEAVHAHFPIARNESRGGSVVVEQMIRGKDYRVLVVNGEVVAAAERVPAHVVGDGTHTVADLVDLANANPLRGIGHEKPLTRIIIDEESIETLERQGLTLDQVPEPGQWVRLKGPANMSTGGTAIDCTDLIHPDNVEIALEAALVVGLDVAGIDFITPDISRSVHDVGGAIVEINAAPGFRMHTHPTEGLPRQVGHAVLDMLFQSGESARVPIIAVTGTNGKTTTSRMIAHIMQTHGHSVGLTTSDGIYVHGTQIAAGDMAGPGSARMVLKNPRVEVAVLETARGGILREGLGFDRCNVAVVTNIAEDHLGMSGVETIEDLARVKAVVPASVFRDGTSVLNADDPMTVGMAERARGEILFFSMDETNQVVQSHLRRRGRAVVLRQTPRGGMITLIDALRETNILLAREIPATLDEQVQVNVANALAATAAAIGAGVPLACIRTSLRTFSTAFWQTPGRFNLLKVEDREVLVDYCHNLAGLSGLADFVRRHPAPRSVGVVAMAGDRRDEDIRAFGKLAGQSFDRVIVREHDGLRGRQPGEVAGILEEAVRAGGLPEERVSVVLDELQAINHAIDIAEPGDLVVAMVYRINRTWEALSERAMARAATVVSQPVPMEGASSALDVRHRGVAVVGD